MTDGRRQFAWSHHGQPAQSLEGKTAANHRSPHPAQPTPTAETRHHPETEPCRTLQPFRFADAARWCARLAWRWSPSSRSRARPARARRAHAGDGGRAGRHHRRRPPSGAAWRSPARCWTPAAAARRAASSASRSGRPRPMLWRRGQASPRGAGRGRPARLDAVEAAFARGDALLHTVPPSGPARHAPSRAVAPAVVLQAGGGWNDTLVSDAMQIVLFGAGHVGHAPGQGAGQPAVPVRWVDERDTLFPPGLPANVAPRPPTRPRPRSTRPRAAATSVMTHSHALDGLVRTDPAAARLRYFGLIGSKTKRARFEHRGRARRGQRAPRRDDLPDGVARHHRQGSSYDCGCHRRPTALCAISGLPP